MTDGEPLCRVRLWCLYSSPDDGVRDGEALNSCGCQRAQPFAFGTYAS